MKHVGYIAGTGNIIYPLRENDKEEEREEVRVMLCISKPEEPEEPEEPEVTKTKSGTFYRWENGEISQDGSRNHVMWRADNAEVQAIKPEQEPEEPTEIKERWVFDKNGVGRREK